MCILLKKYQSGRDLASMLSILIKFGSFSIDQINEMLIHHDIPVHFIINNRQTQISK